VSGVAGCGVSAAGLVAVLLLLMMKFFISFSSQKILKSTGNGLAGRTT
jgi:hypothetical protein